MREDLRALLRDDLSAERPPPLGDVVRAALRDGRRIRRRRRFTAAGTGVALAAILSGGLVSLGGEPREERLVSPGSVPIPPSGPAGVPATRTLAVHSGTTASAGGLRKKATPAAMLNLLTQLLPPGEISGYAVAPGGGLHVQVLLDDGRGPATVRVALARSSPAAEPRGGTATVTVRHTPGDCRRDMVVSAGWPDGTEVRLDVASCAAVPAVPATGRARPAEVPVVTVDQAVRVAADPRWGLTMDAVLVEDGAKRFRALPEFAG